VNSVIEECAAILGPQGILIGEDVTNRVVGFGSEQSIQAQAILRPDSTDQVAECLRRCHAAGQKVVPHGGITNLVQSAHTVPSDVVISLERLNEIEEVDPIGRTMTVQAGVPLQVVQQEAEKYELIFPVDLGARGSCQIGGNVSTNAGGNRVIRYGMTRDNVLGLEAVLADGTVISSLNRMIKNNAGYDLKHLFIGTEGTLGIITRLVLRLREASISENTAFVAFENFENLTRFLKLIDRELGGALSAFEAMWNDFYRLVTTAPAKTAPPLPQDYPYYVLVESAGGDQTSDSLRFEQAMERAFEAGYVADAVIAKSGLERAAMWGMRDDVEQIRQIFPSFNFDVSLAIKDMEPYLEALHKTLDERWPHNKRVTFGHVGDGNLHFSIGVGDGGHEAHIAVEKCVYEPLQRINGSISAEHGIGLEKKEFLHLCRTTTELELMRTLKNALDPKGILNPGKIFDS
jgi:FAD/FMN-containing dehydrogenase